MVQTQKPKNQLHDLGYKIFLDRYAQKDMTRETLTVGDTVIVVVNPKTGQREVGKITALELPKVTIQLLDGETVIRDIEHVDKPIETDPGQMMDRVARGIADVEKTKKKQKEWTQKFRWLLDDWKFVPGGRILTGAGTDQQLTFYNCMPPEQEVLTMDGYKPIAEIALGELVVTHRNRLRPVLHKFERETEEDLYIIHPKKVGYDALRVTGDHKILVIRSAWVNSHRSRDGLRLAQEPAWIPAKDVQAGDYLAVAYDSEECPPDALYVSDYLGEQYSVTEGKVSKATTRGRVMDWGTHYSLNERLDLDEDLCYVFGRWLGDGCITHRTGTDIPSGIKIVFSMDEREEAEHIADIIAQKFGIHASIKTSSTGRWIDLWVNSLPFGTFFKGLFGAYSHSKRIPTDLMHLPENLTTALLRGLFQADGYISNQQLGILLANRTLTTQIHQLLLRLGYLFSIKENTHKNGKTPSYRVSAYASECAPLFEAFFDKPAPQYDKHTAKIYLEHDNLRWIRIDKIDVETYRGVVMDIEVEEDHSFVSAGVVVSNCYVIPSPHDSRDGIMKTLTQMTEIMSRGGGVGINLSSLRPRHAYVKGVNGRSSGSVSWGALYSFVTGLIEQGGSRRGALMLILNDWHPDVFDFINSKRQAGNITNANISVGISDTFMDAVKADGDWELRFPDTSDPAYDAEWDGDIDTWQANGHNVIHYKTIKARELWNAIIESAWASAEPGVWFRERSNKMANSWYFNPLISTNPCFTGDTRIYTDKGLVKAIELFDDETQFEAVIDGRFGLDTTTTPSTRVFMTGIKPIFKLETEEGYTLRATADHRIMTPRGWVELQDLREGDFVHILNRKGGFGQEGSQRLGAILGWLVGDGSIKADRAVLSFFGDEKRELAPLFAEYVTDIVEPMTTRTRAYTVGVVNVAERDEARVQSERLRHLAEDYGLVENKHQVPEIVFQGTEDMQRGFLQALFTADGSVQQTTSNATVIRLASSYIGLLEQVQLLLANFGIACRIFKNRRQAQYRPMPDGKGGTKEYWVQAQHEIHIAKSNILTFRDEIGFMMDYKNQSLETRIADYKQGPRLESFTIKVKSITEDGLEPVYDITEPITHSVIVNSFVTHQCGEQPLGGFSVCNLGAINLAKFYDAENHDVHWEDLGQTVEYSIRFLDNVIDTTPYFFEENAKVQGDERRVGLGTMGIAELMIYLNIRYGSDESVEFIEKLYKFIAVTAYKTSASIAKEKGAFPKFDAEKLLLSGFMENMPNDVRDQVRQDGLRNVTLLTQAPTGTTGTMVNTSTGVEPFFSWVYYRKSRLGLHEEKVPIVQEWLDANPGKTADDLPDYFITAMDLAPREHIRVQGAFQKWIDSAISKTANLPNNYTVEQTRELYEYMYELGCKGGTIYRDGSRDEQVLMLKGDERAESEAESNKKAEKPEKVTQVATPHRVYPRPNKLQGVTIHCPTPFGTAYVTINSDEHGYPFEVFITAPGKAGSDLQADAEGLGRMISLSLRTTDPHNRVEMLKLIIEQLRDIGGARSVGFGPRRVISLPDSVARALEDQYFPQNQAQQLGLPMMDMPPAPAPMPSIEPATAPQPEAESHAHLNGNGILSGADMCPSCGTISLIRAEGCRKCMTCGYSEC